VKLTKRLLEKMIREAVKQYAVDPDQWMTQSPLEPGYAGLKNLAQSGDIENINMAKELGYTPEITGDERVFGSTGDPIMRFIINRTEDLEAEPDEFDLQMKFMIGLRELSDKMKELLRTGNDKDSRDFYVFADNLYHKLINLTYEGYDDGVIPSMKEAIYEKSPKIIEMFRKNHPMVYSKVLAAIKEIQ